jgi:hypothetical protein
MTYHRVSGDRGCDEKRERYDEKGHSVFNSTMMERQADEKKVAARSPFLRGEGRHWSVKCRSSRRAFVFLNTF